MSVIGKNIFWLVISQLATWVATLVTLLIVPDRLGKLDFGAYSFAFAYMMFFSLVAGLGTSTYLARAVARDPEIIPRFVWSAIPLKILIATVCAAVALGLAVVLGNTGTTLLLIAIGCVGLYTWVLNEIFTGVLTGLSRMARPAMWLAVQVYVQSALAVIVLLLGGGVVLFAIVMALGPFIPLVATGLMVRPLIIGRRQLDLNVWRLLIRGGIPLAVLGGLNTIYSTVDVPILHRVSGDGPVGWYALAYRWVGIPVFISTAVGYAFFPAFSQHGKTISDEFTRLVNRASHIVLFVTAPAAVGIALIANDLVHWLYKPEYGGSIVLIQILAFHVPLAALGTVLVTALISSDRMRRYIWVSAVAAIGNPLLCYPAVRITQDRYGNGAIGAAIMTVITEIWVVAGALWLRSPGVIDRRETARIGRIVVASGLMVPAVLLVRDTPLIVQVLVGGATYAVAALGLGAISMGEIRQMVDQLRTGLRRRQPSNVPAA